MGYRRGVYVLCAIPTILLGLASRRYASMLPQFFAEYGGDTLWALTVFLMVSMLRADWPLFVRAALALLIAFLVEFSQLYHADWLDSLRQWKLVRLVLGSGFLWTDLICYTLGIAAGVAAEMLARSRWWRLAATNDSAD